MDTQYHTMAQYHPWLRQKCWVDWRWSLRGCYRTYGHLVEHGLSFLTFLPECAVTHTFTAALKWRQHDSSVSILHVCLFFSHNLSYLPLSLRFFLTILFAPRAAQRLLSDPMTFPGKSHFSSWESNKYLFLSQHRTQEKLEIYRIQYPLAYLQTLIFPSHLSLTWNWGSPWYMIETNTGSKAWLIKMRATAKKYEAVSKFSMLMLVQLQLIFLSVFFFLF